jgi:hypothetical protein
LSENGETLSRSNGASRLATFENQSLTPLIPGQYNWIALVGCLLNLRSTLSIPRAGRHVRPVFCCLRLSRSRALRRNALMQGVYASQAIPKAHIDTARGDDLRTRKPVSFSNRLTAAMAS